MPRCKPSAAVLLLVASLCCVGVHGSPRYSVHGRLLPPLDVSASQQASYFSQAKLLLDGGAHVGFVAADGSFALHDLPAASYTLEVAHASHGYPTLRVDVHKQFDNNVRVLTLDLTNALPPTVVPYDAEDGLILKPLGRINYFEAEPTWSIRDVLMNPMVLMVVVPLALMYMMPSKEKMDQMKEEMRNNGEADPLSGILGGDNKPKVTLKQLMDGAAVPATTQRQS